MLARAFSETSGKISSRTSPRSEEDAEALGAFADGNVPVRTEAGVGAASAELSGSAIRFFSAVFSESRVADVADGSEDPRPSFRRFVVRCNGLCPARGAEAVAADDEASERWPRIFRAVRNIRDTRLAENRREKAYGRAAEFGGGSANSCFCAHGYVPIRKRAERLRVLFRTR